MTLRGDEGTCNGKDEMRGNDYPLSSGNGPNRRWQWARQPVKGLRNGPYSDEEFALGRLARLLHHQVDRNNGPCGAGEVRA
jgi:hypothetical protein